jgi:hypothetical protein
VHCDLHWLGESRSTVGLPGYPESVSSSIEICRLCRANPADSFEHVPPRAALNDEPQTVHGLDDWLARAEEGKMPGGRIEQRDAGAPTLCQRCNNNTGSWYGNELARAVGAGARILRDAPLEEFDALTEHRYASIRFRQSETGAPPPAGARPYRLSGAGRRVPA